MTITNPVFQSALGGIISLTMAASMAAVPAKSINSEAMSGIEADLDCSQLTLSLDQDNLLNEEVRAASNDTQTERKPIAIVLPTPIPTPKPPVFASAQIQKIPALESSNYDTFFNQYANQFGVDEHKLKTIANCESHYNPGAVGGNGLYGGMYQYSASTWQSTRNAMGLDPNPDLRFDAEASIMTSAFKIASGGIGAWPVCSHR